MTDDGPLRAGTEHCLRVKILRDDVPGALRFRQFLKTMLRSYGIKNEGFCSWPVDADGKPLPSQ